MADLRETFDVFEEGLCLINQAGVLEVANSTGRRLYGTGLRRDLDALAVSCARGRALGFLGRAAIHPRQLPVIERAFLPTEREIEEAETIVKAAMAEEGAQALADGRFIDAAVVAAAQRTLSLSRRT